MPDFDPMRLSHETEASEAVPFDVLLKQIKDSLDPGLYDDTSPDTIRYRQLIREAGSEGLRGLIDRINSENVAADERADLAEHLLFCATSEDNHSIGELLLHPEAEVNNGALECLE